MKILFVDACARKNSRTRKLAEVLIEKLQNTDNPQDANNSGCTNNPEKSNILKETCDPKCTEKPVVEHLVITDKNLPEINEKAIIERDEDFQNRNFDKDIYKYAKQFATADIIVIAAPYWDLSFPASLKKYIEAITVTGITFRYSEEGYPTGLCNAEKLYYVTTSGGPIINEEFGYGYIKSMAQGMYGIKDCQCFSAQNLDIVGNDINAILEAAMTEIRNG